MLATHSDRDHFSARAVSRCLKSNPRAAFVAPTDTARQVTGFDGRVHSVEVAEGQRRHLAVNGIGIDAMFLSHGGPQLVNLGYLITIGNQKFFHTGDISVKLATAAYMKPFNLPAEHIDVAFVPHHLLSTRAPLSLVTQSIQPRVVFASHLNTSPDAGQIKWNFPSAVVPRTTLESWPHVAPESFSCTEHKQRRIRNGAVAQKFSVAQEFRIRPARDPLRSIASTPPVAKVSDGGRVQFR